MTKKKIAWITDSTAYITEELRNHPDVYVIPLGIVFGNDVFEDGIDLSTEQLYERIRNNKDVPKTSQPPVGAFVTLFNELKEKYEQAIAVHISSKLSGTLSTCSSASKMANFPVEVIDSKSMSYSITTLINRGLALAEKGQDVPEIANSLRSGADQSENYILLGSLDQFYKGGRMSSTSYLLGNILQIKPIIRINRLGEFELFQKVRSEKKAIKRIIELLEQAKEKHHIQEVQIMHGNVLSKAKELEAKLQERFSNLQIFIGEISSTIAAHAGEGTLVLIWQNDQ